MGSKSPYGVPPWPGQGSAGPAPEQSPPRYGYPQQPGPGGPSTGSSGYSFGPFSPDPQDPQPGRYGSPPGWDGAGPAQTGPQPKGKGQILIIGGAARRATNLRA